MTQSQGAALPQERQVKQAMLRGALGRCPACGKGKLFTGYLTVNDHCSNCGQELHHHRADDGPAYLTILIVGHLLAPLLMFVFVRYRPEPLTMMTVFSIGTVALSLYLLPRLKGVMVAMQWSKRMHGFGQASARD